ncbi:hypothetical protein HY250_01130 [Candidatus Azambacteria bacterium]|nr:hypothetical protein [Candidatus Azambacteria bacterium]MBI3684990.1 hypothetical protein [Candidatus Azambacteria bacterium]
MEPFINSAEKIIEVINAVLGIAAIFFAVGVMHKVQGGALEKVWKLITVSALFFGLFEILGSFQNYQVLTDAIDIEFIREIIELLTIGTLVMALMKAKKAFSM